MIPLAVQMREHMEVSGAEADDVIVWDRFPSQDPNIRLRIDAIKNKDVVFLMNMDSMCAPRGPAVVHF